MLFGQVAGLPLLLGTPDGWPLILAGVVVPAAVQLIFFQPFFTTLAWPHFSVLF